MCQEVFSNADDKVMECEYCEMKFCTKCLNISDAQYELVGDPQFSWYCENCKMKVERCIKNEKDIEKRCEEYMKNLDKKYETRFQKIESQVTNIENNLKAAPVGESGESVKKVVEDKLQEHKEELKQRESRVNNMIIFKLPEPETNLKAERAKLDKTAVIGICSAVDVEDIEEENIVSTVRLGKKKEDGTARPLLVRLDSSDTKKNLFTNLGKLKENETYKDVSVNHDLTKKQREEYKKLVAEALKKEGEAPSENIRYRVRGPPWAWHIRKVVATEEEEE